MMVKAPKAMERIPPFNPSNPSVSLEEIAAKRITKIKSGMYQKSSQSSVSSFHKKWIRRIRIIRIIRICYTVFTTLFITMFITIITVLPF
jgi:hypothetical protein